MKNILLAGAAVAAIATANSAIAADIGARPMLGRAPVASSWTGCYLGGHLGWGWSAKDISETGLNLPGPTVNAAGRIDASGGVFGTQLGCNFQFASTWVIGIEGAASATDINGQNNDPWNSPPATNGDSDNFNHVKVDWITSLTGRLGMTWNQSLFYVRGGGAWANDRWNVSDTLFGSFGERTGTRTGWTIGGGVEWAFATNWTAFAEFNHYDFGTASLATSADLAQVTTFGVTRFDVKQTLEAAKVGINYRFY